MKKKLLLIGIILFIGVSMSFYSCKKDSDENVGDANATGVVINSQNGLGLANATLYFTRDLTATDYNNSNYTVTSDQNGNYTITNAVAGTYLCFVVSNGYFVRQFQVTLVSGTNTLDPVTLVNAPAAGSFRIVLTWGLTPSDLDSHLTGPDGSGGRFHMYFSGSAKNPNQYISLDVDDTSGQGPETTTISGFFNGMYRFSVHNYTNKYTANAGAEIKSSPAKVELYDSSGLKNTFNPPAFTGNGDTWRVFEIVVSGTNKTINTINTYVLSTSYSDITIFKSGTEKVGQFKINDF
ncbi:MAG: carboxypeptidase regulatory-like domain-containing protein [Bacteroidetes bacterium]|nr:carboxypeptidase regulatory-like domain-containing protein [Bacteroidota bacterium]